MYTTHIFSERGTWAATLLSLFMTAILFLFFLVFNFNEPYFVYMYEPGMRAMNGWFSAVMVYNAGFNSFDLSMMDVGSQVPMILSMFLLLSMAID